MKKLILISTMILCVVLCKAQNHGFKWVDKLSNITPRILFEHSRDSTSYTVGTLKVCNDLSGNNNQLDTFGIPEIIVDATIEATYTVTGITSVCTDVANVVLYREIPSTNLILWLKSNRGVVYDGSGAKTWGLMTFGALGNQEIGCVYGDDTKYTFSYTTNGIIYTSFIQITNQHIDGTVNLKIRANNTTPSFSYLAGSTSTSSSGNITDFSVGRTGDYTGSYFTGDVAEIIIYNSALSLPDIIIVEDYLHTKYPSLY